jgi:hypothetical protein
MASNKITIILSEKDELEIKNMVEALRMEKGEENPYFDRSESWIAKRILKPALVKEFKKYVKGQK